MSGSLRLVPDDPEPSPDETLALRIPRNLLRHREAPPPGIPAQPADQQPGDQQPGGPGRPGHQHPRHEDTLALRVVRAHPRHEETLALRVIRAPGRPQWAPEDPLDELAERLAEVCAAAVHPYEIAAVLEAAGLTDEQAALRYGRPDSFALAEDLFQRVQRSYPEPKAPAVDPWRGSLWHCLLRGLVFALPGLAYLLAAPLLGSRSYSGGADPGTLALASSVLVGWSWNQALSHRAYSWLGLGARAEAAGCLGVGALLGALLGAAAAAPWGAPGAVVAFAAGQSAYLSAATVLMVLGRQRYLLVAIAPTAAGAGVTLLVDLSPAQRGWTLACSLAVAVALAAGRVLRSRRTGRSPAAVPAARSASLPHGLFGLAVGVLVLLASLGDVWHFGAGGAVNGPSAVALTLSMGAAEWLLYRFRSRSLAGLRVSRTTSEFLARTGRTLIVTLGGYLAALALVGYAAALLWPNAPLLDGLRLPALLLLGAVLWTALLLQAFGAAWPPAAVCAAAAVAETAAMVGHLADPAVLQLAVCGGAALLLVATAQAQLSRVTAHR
ncbi:hypothetical protein [Peterkaempfera bronchialis]|uniref:hypothetical protein n=1 Tax=Peterkaempfera bronchialis TaxID=2126346 RepID=UPI001E36B04F|nr:hypothetical protein [Peterkaempfera bronchialis]